MKVLDVFLMGITDAGWILMQKLLVAFKTCKKKVCTIQKASFLTLVSTAFLAFAPFVCYFGEEYCQVHKFNDQQTQ